MGGLDRAATKLAPDDRFELSAAQGTLISLNKLCAPCTAFIDSSALLRKLSQGKRIKVGSLEVGYVGTTAQIKHGYLDGSCHLCALLWDPARVHLLDPAKPSRRTADQRTGLAVELRPVDRSSLMASRRQQKKTVWSRFAPGRSLGEDGYIELEVLALKGIRGDSSPLSIHQSSYPELNREALRKTAVPISSKDERLFDLIKHWQRQCSQNHPKCHEFPHLVAPSGQLPSRLLDVSNNKVRLECNVPNLPAGVEYTTLSHMWGPDPSTYPRLLQSTLATFSADVPIEDLPIKYVDAIRITRALGYRFIWIDSLCIVQDSAEDWRREAVKMAAVYGRSRCNISYTFPPSPESAGNHLRDPRVELPCQTPPPKRSRKVAGSDGLVIQHLPKYVRPLWSPTLYKRVWPLLSRGWVFQERLLCPRTLYYGQNRLLWECCDGIRDEFYGPLATVPGSKVHFHRVMTSIAASLAARASTAEPHDRRAPLSDSGQGGNLILADGEVSTGEQQWAILIRDYRSNDLSKESDRAIAFAGIARAVQFRADLTYFAGLWRELIEYDLLWSVGPVVAAADATKFLENKAKCVPAPSWSWFSVPTLRTPLGSDILDFPFRTSLLTYRKQATYRAEVVRFDHPDGGTAPDSLLYDFAGMSLTLRARRVPCTLEWREAYDSAAYRVLCALPLGDESWILGEPVPHQGEWITPRLLTYAHDDPLVTPQDATPEGAQMLLTVVHAWHEDSKGRIQGRFGGRGGDEKPEGWKTIHQYGGIVIVPAGLDSGKWRRVGAFMFSRSSAGQSFKTPFDGERAVEEDVVLV